MQKEPFKIKLQNTDRLEDEGISAEFQEQLSKQEDEQEYLVEDSPRP